MIVLDASAVVEVVLGLTASEVVIDRLRSEATVHAPHLLHLEVAQSVRRLVASGRVPSERGAVSIELLADLDLVLHGHGDLLPRIWELRANLSVYDASYIALAEALGASLVTFDSRLARAPGHVAVVELLSA